LLRKYVQGLIMNEIGLEPLMTALLRIIVAPLAELLYPDEINIMRLDHHPSFVVEYSAKGSKDSYLDMHHDASECTVNVCLGKTFTGSGLTFCGQFGSGIAL
jgi:hypothetical protein